MLWQFPRLFLPLQTKPVGYLSRTSKHQVPALGCSYDGKREGEGKQQNWKK